METSTLDQQPLSIQFNENREAFELKSNRIHLLSTFGGLVDEDLNKHLKKFHMTCSCMKSNVITKESLNLMAFPFFLADNAKEWLYYLPSRTINSWNVMKQVLL